MGREIKRVPYGFDWPLHEVWHGYMNPHYRFRRRCKRCGDTGQNRKTRQIADDFYDFAGTGRRWVDNITQDEADALLAHGRLQRRINGEWATPERVTAEEVNAANRPGARSLFGWGCHDAINSWILIETRAKRLGVYGHCPKCGGRERWRRWKDARRAARWVGYEPPKGPGWQVWETVSEGSPISPVFASPQSLVEWLVGEGYSREAAARFAGTGWVMSAMMVDGKMYRDIESAAAP